MNFSESPLCASSKREISSPVFHFLGVSRRKMIFCVRPETTIFIVVSAQHTDMGLGGVPETTVKIGVSGTLGERGKPAEPKKGANPE